MSSFGQAVPNIVPLPQAPNVPSSAERGIVRAQQLILEAAQTGTSLALLSAQEGRGKARLQVAKTRGEVLQQDIETAALQVQAEDARTETIKQRVLTEKAKKKIEDITRLEDDEFNARMKEMSKEDLSDFLKKHPAFDPAKQSEVERYIGRNFAQVHITEVQREFFEFASDPANDPRDFSLIDKLTEKLVEADLSPGAHIAYQNYAFAQIQGMQRGLLSQFAAQQTAETDRGTRSQVVEGFGAFLLGDFDQTDGPMLLADLGQTASDLTVDGSALAKQNELMRAATTAIGNHLTAGTDPKVMLRQVNSLRESMPRLFKALRENGSIGMIEQEIQRAEQRTTLAQISELDKRITIASEGKGNPAAMAQIIDELDNFVIPQDMNEASQAAMRENLNTTSFRARSRQADIIKENQLYNTIILDIAAGNLEAGAVKTANPKVLSQVFDDLMAAQVGSMPFIVKSFVQAGYDIPPSALAQLKRDLDTSSGAANLERAYRVWKAISEADEDRANRLLLSTPTQIPGIEVLRRLVAWTRQAEPDTTEVNEIMAIALNGQFMRAQTTAPAQLGEGEGFTSRYAANVYASHHSVANTLDVQVALGIGNVPANVMLFYMDSFAFRNTMIQMNDLNAGAEVAAMEIQSVNAATADLQSEFHVIEPGGKNQAVIEKRMFPGIGDDPNIAEAVEAGVVEINDNLEGTIQFQVPLKIANDRRWWPVIADDPGFDPSRSGIKAFVEWDSTSNAFQVIERAGNERVFDAGVSRVKRGHTLRELSPITRLQRQPGEADSIGQIDLVTTDRGMEIMNVIERAWDRQSNDLFDIGTPEGRRFAERFARQQLKFSKGFGTRLINRNDPLAPGPGF